MQWFYSEDMFVNSFSVFKPLCVMSGPPTLITNCYPTFADCTEHILQPSDSLDRHLSWRNTFPFAPGHPSSSLFLCTANVNKILKKLIPPEDAILLYAVPELEEIKIENQFFIP